MSFNFSDFDGHTAYALFALVVSILCLVYTVKTTRRTNKVFEHHAAKLMSPVLNGRVLTRFVENDDGSFSLNPLLCSPRQGLNKSNDLEMEAAFIIGAGRKIR